MARRADGRGGNHPYEHLRPRDAIHRIVLGMDAVEAIHALVGAVFGYENGLLNDDVVGAGGLQAVGKPGVFNSIVRARHQKGAVVLAGHDASQQHPGAVLGARAPTPAAAEHEAAIGCLDLGANRVVGTRNQGVRTLGVHLVQRLTIHDGKLEGMHGDDARHPSGAHVLFGDAQMRPKKVLRGRLQAAPRLR